LTSRWIRLRPCRYCRPWSASVQMTPISSSCSGFLCTGKQFTTDHQQQFNKTMLIRKHRIIMYCMYYKMYSTAAWNQLPSDNRNLQSLGTFKSRLEIHLFNCNWHDKISQYFDIGHNWQFAPCNECWFSILLWFFKCIVSVGFPRNKCHKKRCECC